MLAEGAVYPLQVSFWATTQFVGLALVTVACFFSSHDASDSKHIKNKNKGLLKFMVDQLRIGNSSTTA